MDPIEILGQSCEEFERYPQNLLHHDMLGHRLESYTDRLKAQEERLFNRKQAAVDIVDFDVVQREFYEECVTTLSQLKKLLRKALVPGQKEPKCRYIFIHAPHSRAALRISRSMLSFLFSYHQVMPSFLEFVFPFGRQEHAQDFHFGGLREENHIENGRIGLGIPNIGRSGHQIQLCYNLRSVEQSTGQQDFPWSIRQTAIYHSFDLRTGHAVWINVKGNKLMKNRLSETLEKSGTPAMESNSDSFAASLLTHTLFCDWSGENWRWYINDLEAELYALSKGTLAAPIEQPNNPIIGIIPSPIDSRAYTGTFSKSSRTGTSPYLNSPRVGSELSRTYYSGATKLLKCQSFTHSPLESGDRSEWKARNRSRTRLTKRTFGSLFGSLQMGRYSSKPPSATSEKRTSNASLPDMEGRVGARHDTDRILPPELPPNLELGMEVPQQNVEDESKVLEDFTFGDLQRIQYIEEKIQEVLLVLKLNIGVLQDLRHMYRSVTNNPGFPEEIKSNCENSLTRFEKCLLGVEKDLKMQQSRTETLLCLLADRKRLLHDILQYRSMRATETCAKRAQASADKMEVMTDSMHEIARKTKHETVSMRVITSVTLFFLPGTFVATFMSTDILRFSDKRQDFQSKGLGVYLAICIPLMALTFIAWYVVYRVAKKRDRIRGFPELEDKLSTNV